MAVLGGNISEELDILKKSILKDKPGIGGDAEHIGEEIHEQKECILITYSLPGKTRSQKMLFNYELVGRNGKDGLLQKLGGKKVALGCAIVPAEKEGEIEEFLKKENVDFGKQRIILAE